VAVVVAAVAAMAGSSVVVGFEAGQGGSGGRGNAGGWEDALGRRRGWGGERQWRKKVRYKLESERTLVLSGAQAGNSKILVNLVVFIYLNTHLMQVHVGDKYSIPIL